MSATRELLAPVGDVWRFVSEPYNLPDWWPKLGGVEPDRRGLVPGARWRVQGESEPSFLRRPAATADLVVVTVEPERRFAFRLTGDGFDVDLRLEERGATRTDASLAVSGRWVLGTARSLPRQALSRLHALCQTAAEE